MSSFIKSTYSTLSWIIGISLVFSIVSIFNTFTILERTIQDSWLDLKPHLKQDLIHYQHYVNQTIHNTGSNLSFSALTRDHLSIQDISKINDMYARFRTELKNAEKEIYPEDPTFHILLARFNANIDTYNARFESKPKALAARIIGKDTLLTVVR